MGHNTLLHDETAKVFYAHDISSLTDESLEGLDLMMTYRMYARTARGSAGREVLNELKVVYVNGDEAAARRLIAHWRELGQQTPRQTDAPYWWCEFISIEPIR